MTKWDLLSAVRGGGVQFYKPAQTLLNYLDSAAAVFIPVPAAAASDTSLTYQAAARLPKNTN